METHRIIHDSSPSSRRSDLRHPPAGNLSSKRCLVVETYRLHIHHSKEGLNKPVLIASRTSTGHRAKEYWSIYATSTDCQSDQYWSPCEVVLVNICNQYWSTQRLVLVAKPAPHNTALPPHQSPGNKHLKSALHRRGKTHQCPSQKNHQS